MGQTMEKTRKGIVVAPMEEVQKLEMEWLWPGRIAIGSLTLLAGDLDMGKTYLAMELAARVSRGETWPDGRANLGPNKVLLFNQEDHLRSMAYAALEAAGADMTQIVAPWLVREGGPGRERERPVNLKRDLDSLERMVAEMRWCRLVIIDPIHAHMGSGGNMETKMWLRSLMGIAARYHLAIVGVTHLRTGKGEAMHRAVGGLALTAAARAMWMVVKDVKGNSEVGDRKSEVRLGRDGSGEPSYGEGRLLLPVKNNLSADRKGLAFRLAVGEGNCVPRVEWSTEAVEKSADEVMRELRRKPVKYSLAVGQAMEFLKEALADGPRLMKEVEQEAKQERGISSTSLERARSALKVQAYREKVPGRWWICLEEYDRAKEAAASRSENAEVVEVLAENTGNFNDLGQKQAEVVEVLAENTGNSDEFRGEVAEVVEVLGEPEWGFNVAEEEAKLAALVKEMEREAGMRKWDVESQKSEIRGQGSAEEGMVSRNDSAVEPSDENDELSGGLSGEQS
jgi:putative DNA primase/helicase